MSVRKPALGFIFITVFLDMLGIGLIVPILPKLVASFRGGSEAAAAPIVGWLTALYALMQFLFAPVLGSLSDQVGRRRVILVSLLGSGLDYLLLAFAPTLPWFFLGRVVNGISGANITAATAYIADISPPEKRAANFGVLGAAFGLGFIAGPALGGLLGDRDLRLPFMVAAGLSLANWLYGFFVLPESLASVNRRAFSWKRANPVGSLVTLQKYPIVFGLASSLFLLNIAQFFIQSIWVLYTSYRYGWQPKQVGASLAIVGLATAIVQGGLARRIIPALGEVKSMKIGFTIGTLAMIGYGSATHGWMIYAILTVAAFGGIGGPATQGLISRNVAANEQGAVQGALTSLSSVALVIAPLISTNLFAYFINPAAPAHVPGISFFLGAVLIQMALWIALRTLRQHPPHARPPPPV